VTSAKQRNSQRRALRPGVEYEYDEITLSRELSRNVVTRFLVDRAESGGWEIARVRVGADGHRRVVLRRKIIRQQQLYWFAS
jgi:hypothetical protein